MNNTRLKERVQEGLQGSTRARNALFNKLALELVQEIAESYSGFTGDAAREILKLKQE